MRSAIKAIINTEACVKNCSHLAKIAGERKFFPVVKADAYGHGLERISAAIASTVDGFCVFETATALTLRELGVEQPIVVLGGLGDKEEADAAKKMRLWPVLGSPRHVELASEPRRFERIIVKVQTGMHRLGLEPAAVNATVERLRSQGCSNLMLMQHFADADLEDGTKMQRKVMGRLTEKLQLPFSESNSAATLLADPCGEEFVRCGIGIYGSTPDTRPAKQHGLEPVMRLESEVIAVQQLAKGETVGYGSRWVADSPTTVAVVACGYADGYPRHAPDGTPVAINGQILKLAGRVSMEMLTVEVPDGRVAIGDRAQMWGDLVPVDTVARLAGTVGYELLAGLPAKVRRQSYLPKG